MDTGGTFTRKTLFLAAVAAFASVMFAEGGPRERTKTPTETMFFFDAEDFTSDHANNAIRDLALLCTEEGVRAHFAIVGFLGERFVRFGRRDVVEALKPHVVGTQSLYHSVHPNILELSDRRDYMACYRDVMGEEARGVGMLEAVLGRKMMCAVPPGSSKSYVAMYVYADLGIPFYCDTVVADGQDGDISYCNIRQIPYTYSFMPESLLPARSPQMPDLKPILDSLAKRRRIILFAHPNNALFSEAWDGINYFRTNAVAWGEWKQPKRIPASETAEFYSRLHLLIRALKADGRFRFVDLDRLAAGEKPRVAIRRADVPRIYSSLCADFTGLRDPSWSVADCFLAAVAFLRGETLYRPGKVYGFLEAPRGVTSPVTVTRAGLEAAARTMDVGGFLPSSIAVDGREIGPADFLIAALDVLATGAGSVVVSPKEQLGDLSRFPKLRDFRPAGGWVFTPGFKDVYASDRLRWQFWTLRYIDRMQD